MKGLIYGILLSISLGVGSFMALPKDNNMNIVQPKIEEKELKEMKNDLTLTKEFLLKSYESSNEAFEKLHLNDVNKLDEQIALEYHEEYEYWLNELNELIELFKKNLPYEEFKIVEFRKLSLMKGNEKQEEEIVHQYEGTQLLNLLLNRFRSDYTYKVCKILVNEYM